LDVVQLGPPKKEKGSYGWFGCCLLSYLENKEFYFFEGKRVKANSAYGGVPLVSQHSRSQALVKEKGCVRRGESM